MKFNVLEILENSLQVIYLCIICYLFLFCRISVFSVTGFTMPQGLIIKIIIVLASSFDVIVEGERHQFFLDIYDMLDSSWIQSKYNVVGTTVQCASLCYRQRDKCAYFGYKEATCYLLKDTVDRNVCSKEDCTDSGMKVFKVNKFFYYSD